MKHLCAALAAAMLLAGTASAVPIVGGVTQVSLSSAPTLASLGIGVSGVGTATLDGSVTPPLASFPITGGSTNGVTILEHDGSGLALSSGMTSISLTNFLINTGTAQLTGSVNSGAPGVPLFDIGPGLQLTLTSTAAGALNSTFSTTAFTPGLTVGTAAVSPVVVPEPANMALMGAGAALLFVMRRRRVR